MYVILRLTCLLVLFYATSIKAQTNKFVMEPTTQIGLEDPEDMNYMFSNIRAVAVNSQGDIYITNTSDHTIRVFDQDGKFIRKLGGKGRGPGEFMDLTSISIDSDDRVVAVDRFQDKVIRYESNSSDFESFLSPESSLATLRMTQTLPNEKLLMVYKYSVGPNSEANLIHVVDQVNEKIIGRYVDTFALFYDRNKPIEVEMSSSPRYEATKFASGKIAISPGDYTGTIAIFDTKTASTQLIGQRLTPFYEEFTSRNREYYESQGIRGIISMSGQNGRFMFRPHGYVLGLVGNSKYLLQFYLMHEDNRRIAYVDIYSNEGKLISKQSLIDSGIDFYDGRYYQALPKFLDEDNKLYVFDNNGYPKVQVYHTNLDEF